MIKATIDIQALFKRLHRLNLLRFLRSRFLNTDFFSTEINGLTRVATIRPEHVQQVLITKAKSFGRIYSPITPFTRDGLLTSEGDLWKRRRSTLQPHFRQRSVQNLRPTIRQAVNTSVSRWPEGELDMLPALHHLVNEVMVSALFSPEAWDDELVEVLTAITLLTGVQRIDPNAGTDDELWQACEQALERQVQRIVDVRNPQPFLQELLACNLTKEELKTELRGTLLGGQDTMSGALGYTIRHGLHKGDVTNTIKEALRIHPPLYCIPRLCIEDVELFDGLQLTAGDEIVLWTCLISNDERWWPEPKVFNPKRFEEKVKPGTYAPFGLGHHNCLGKHVAQIIMEETVSVITATFELQFEQKLPRYVPLITLTTTDPMIATLKRRA